MSPKQKTLHVGIDLGTSRSSISTSSDKRHMIQSYVGWPVDLVANKVLKREVLVGQEALDNRSMLDLHRPLEEGLIKEGSEKDEAAVRELLKTLAKLAGVDSESRGDKELRAVIGVPAEALRVSKAQVHKALAGLADRVMIVSEPFAVAYGLEALLHSLIIDIGAGTADFCVMNGRFPTEDEQRTLNTAGDWIDDRLAQLVSDRHPEAKISVHMLRQWKEDYSFVGKAKSAVKVTAPVDGVPTQLDITDELRQACEGILPPVTETMMDLLAKVEPEFQEKVRHNVILAGGSALIKGLAASLQQQLEQIGGGRVTVVKDPIFAGSDGGLALALDAPESEWEKMPA